jgi:hypothetical protein
MMKELAVATKVYDINGRGDYDSVAAANAAIADGSCTRLEIARPTSIPAGWAVDGSLTVPASAHGMQIVSEDGDWVDLTPWRNLIGATWINYSGDIWYTDLPAGHVYGMVCYPLSGAWTDGTGLTYLQPIAGANIAAVAGSLTVGKSYVAGTRLYINIGGNPTGAELYATYNPTDATSYNWATGLNLGAAEDQLIDKIRVCGCGLYDAVGGNADLMGAWGIAISCGNGSIVNVWAEGGTRHSIGSTNIPAGATVDLTLRAEKLVPSGGSSGVAVFTTGGGAGATVNLTMRCDKGKAVYGDATGAVIAAGSGSALLIHDGGADFAAFHVTGSTISGGQFQVNDNNGPITVTDSTLLAVALGSVAPITSGFTMRGGVITVGIPVCTNATDVVNLSNVETHWPNQLLLKGVHTWTGVTFDLSDTGIANGGRMLITGGYAANCSLTVTDCHFIGTGATAKDISLFYQLRANNIVAWNRNKYTNFYSAIPILENFDSDNNDASDGIFRAPECAYADTAAKCVQSLGYDLDNHTSERNVSQARLRNLVPAALFPMNEPAGFLCRDVMATTAGKYLFKTSGAGMVRDGDSLYVNTAGLGNTRVGSTRAMIAPPAGGAWKWSVFFNLKAGAQESYVLSQRNSLRSGDYLLIWTGSMATAGQNTKLGLYVGDGTARMGTSAAHYFSTFGGSIWRSHMVVVSDDGAGKFSAKWWQDGVYLGETAKCDLPTNFGTGTTMWVLGDISDPTSTMYIKNLAIWNRALTETQVLSLFQEEAAAAAAAVVPPPPARLGLAAFSLGL